MRAAVAAVVALVATFVVAPGVASAADDCLPAGGGTLPSLPSADGEVVIRGRGWGHGTGMSQYGAYGAALLGCTHDQILSTYFPGATYDANHPVPTGIRVNLDLGATVVPVTAEQGTLAWQWCYGSGRCSSIGSQAAGEQWRVVVEGYAADDTSPAEFVLQRLADGKWTQVWRGGHAGTHRPGGCSGCSDNVLRAALTGTPHSASPNYKNIAEVTAGGRTLPYRWGYLEFDSKVSSSATSMWVNLEIPDFEKYLYGIGEVPSGWPAETLEAQAVAARSYALERYHSRQPMDTTCRCHLYATTKDQNYVGWDKEGQVIGGTNYGALWVGAVDATKADVLTYGGKPIPAFYSSSHGGASESYAFWSGGADRPYLKAVDDSRWEAASKNPLSAWVMTTTAKKLDELYGIGTLTSITTPDPKGAKGRIGRPDAGYGGVRIAGSRKTVTVSGAALRSALGGSCARRDGSRVYALCSTMFTVEYVPPADRPVPPPAGAILLTGDWDGDGIDTPGWFKDGEWGLHPRNAATGGTMRLSYGQKGDKPVVGDWDGDGIDTVGVVRGNLWILRNEYRRGAEDIKMYYGEATDKPVTGDWDGDGIDTLGVVRGNLWILRSEYHRDADDVVLRYGEATDKPVTGDWDADGVDTIGVVRGNLWILRSVYKRGADDVVMRYGEASDVPVTGDWNGDDRDTLGIVRDRLWVLRSEYRSGADDIKFNY